MATFLPPRGALINFAAVAAVALGFGLIVVRNAPGHTEGSQLLNVSYDPTRELYQAINPMFAAAYEKETGRRLAIVQRNQAAGACRRDRARDPAAEARA
jgi:ABC-type sulfate transport system substrate-binding protein